MATEPTVDVCDGCGATVYPEHIESHKAERVAGRLLCRHCLAEQRTAAQTAPPPGEEPLEEPLELIELPSEEAAPTAPPKPDMKRFSSNAISFAQGAARETGFRRSLLTDSPNATRCRTFHAKLNDASLAHLNDVINEWVDNHDDVEIKFATSSIGVVEGKHQDVHLIVTVFY